MTRRFGAVCAAILLAGAGLGLLHPRVMPDPADRLIRELGRQSGGAAPEGTRLSFAPRFHACAPAFPAQPCALGATPDARMVRLVRETERDARTAGDPRALHALGITHMLYGDSEGNSLGRSISFLQSAARLAEQPAPALADLAAAYLARAARTRQPGDLYLALEAAQHALDLDPANPSARFNAAVALEQAGLVLQAHEEWARYLAADSTSGWAAEARRRLRALDPPPRPRRPGRDAAAAELAAYAVQAPLEAREMGSDELLGDWGAAVLAGDTAIARASVAQAEVLGAALVRSGGDASLADHVREVRARQANPVATRRLAALHLAFAAGRAAIKKYDYARAAGELRAVVEDSTAPSPLRQWAELFTGISAIYQPEVADAVTVLEGVVARTDSVRYPALAARARWALGSAQQRRGRAQASLDVLLPAAALFRRAREAEHEAAVAMAVGDARTQLGRGAAAYESLHQAATALRGNPGARPRYTLLFVLGPALAADGLHRAALRIQDEAVGTADRTGQADLMAEARLLRARLRLQAGHGGGTADVEAARALIASASSEFARSWLLNDLRETLGMQALATHPARADTLLTPVAGFFSARKQPGRLLPVLVARAEARLAMGRAPEAEDDLDASIALLDSLRAHTPSAELRASLLEASRRVFDRGVMLHLARGNREEALDFAEWGRASFSPMGHAADWHRRPLRVPVGQVALELALVGDTLLAWTVSGAGIEVTRTTVRREALVREVEQVRTALEMRSGENAVRPALGRLYDRLIRPVRGRLGPPGTPLVVVADGELAALAVPERLQGERERGRYLVEDHPLRFRSTLRDPVRVSAPRTGHTPVVLVARPAFDAHAFPGLGALPGAEGEVSAIAGLYAGARVVAGAQARPEAVRRAFRAGGIAHFAGHAVFDDARPERSFLVLAPGRPGEADRLTAAEIERMDLRKLRLVVLSACQTSRGQSGRSGGFSGLAGAFLAAGAGGVVGSLWQVDDGNTRALMESFHRAYLRSGDGAGALRQAQIEMLRSGGAALRSPAAWAGFRYAGG